MENKEIYIDGVDVSGCPHIEYDHKWWDIAGREQNSENVCSLSFDNNADFDEDFICGQNPNCYYKQLKRKEQECEALGQAYLETNELLQEKTKECTNLKAENEELKEEIDDLKEIIQRHDNDNNALLSEFEDDLVEYYRKYKDCLTEIKEMIPPPKGAKLHLVFEEILKKISEAEDENN